MADLYARLQELKKRRQDGSPAGTSVTPTATGPISADGAAGSVAAARPPGTEWKPVAPGVYERSQVFPTQAGTLPFEVDHEGRWFGVSPLVGNCSGTRPILLDVETSGLSGGAGSTAFLIGLGFLAPPPRPRPPARTHPRSPPHPQLPPQGPEIIVHQLFLSEPAAEAALLTRYAELVGDPETICYVTYNGASFDLPVLRTRHIMNRGRFPEALHWDLMPLTRRLYAPVIGSCSLGRVESLVLGLTRHEDVPGSEVPARYHRFIDTGDTDEIAPVVAHHFYDVAHLAVLAGALQSTLGAEPPGSGAGHTPGGAGHAPDGSASPYATGHTTHGTEPPPARDGSQELAAPPRGSVATYDRVALAKVLLHRGGASELFRCAALLDDVRTETEQRRRHVAAAARAGGFAARLVSRPPREWSESRELRAVVARRLKQWDELREIRREIWEVRGSRRDAVELAKVLEHRFRDYLAALQVIELWQERSGTTDDETVHRAERLRRKIACS